MAAEFQLPLGLCLQIFSTIQTLHKASVSSVCLLEQLKDYCPVWLSFLACSAVCAPPSCHSPECVFPCLPSLPGHDECSPISVVQAAGRKGKQTQQAAVVDLFIGPQSSSQASAPRPGPDTQTSKSCFLRKKTQMEVHKLVI